MIIYVVGNDDYTVDYYIQKANAEKEMERVNMLCDEYKNNPDVNSTYVFITEIATAD